jgi:hypothetical protein
MFRSRFYDPVFGEGAPPAPPADAAFPAPSRAPAGPSSAPAGTRPDANSNPGRFGAQRTAGDDSAGGELERLREEARQLRERVSVLESSMLSSPCRVVLERAARDTHAIDGFLSEKYGFLPPGDSPVQRLPTSHQLWDVMARRLSHLYRSAKLRKEIDVMPELDASPASLPDQYLHRAASLLGMFTYCYYKMDQNEPESLPACIENPWIEVSTRLHRYMPHLSFMDVMGYNWVVRQRNDNPREARVVENMALSTEAYGNLEERVFYLTILEHVSRCPTVGEVTRAQEAVLLGDNAALIRELTTLTEDLKFVTAVTLQKIDPNPYSSTHVDPITWAKTVAPFAAPIRKGMHGMSGLQAPIWHVLDILIGRKSYESTFLGREALELRDIYPRHWQDFFAAIEKGPSFPDYVAKSGDPRLQGVWGAFLDCYVGEHGWLTTHKLKVYGMIETSAKVGRTTTNGGIQGEEPYVLVDRELRVALEQRPVPTCPLLGRLVSRDVVGPGGGRCPMAGDHGHWRRGRRGQALVRRHHRAPHHL